VNVGTSGRDPTTTALVQGNLALTSGTKSFNVRDGSQAVDLNVEAVISGAGGVSVTSPVALEPGVTVFSGANTYTGTTSVSLGTLLVNNTTGSGTGTNNVTVGVDGILGGSGFIDPADTKTVTVNGRLSPGNSIGTLTVGSPGSTNDVTFNSGSFFDVELGAAQADKLAVFGNLTLSGSPTLNLLGTADGVTNYVIATYTGALTGTFAPPTLPSGYTIDYGTGSNSAITLLVPEPASLSLLGLGGLALLRRRRA
jgi:autotransporter-associated beta strand protein